LDIDGQAQREDGVKRQKKMAIYEPKREASQSSEGVSWPTMASDFLPSEPR
jgi:hypothetical protein